MAALSPSMILSTSNWQENFDSETPVLVAFCQVCGMIKLIQGDGRSSDDFSKFGQNRICG